MNEVIFAHSAEDTEKAGEKFSKKLKGGDVVFLKGQLGSGKTTFTKGLARGLGISTRIISPTFIVVREHSVKGGVISTIKRLYHLDLYRLSDEKDVLTVDLKDYLKDDAAAIVIEWPEVGQNIVQKEHWCVEFQQIGEGRQITISYGQ
jgi:tRNA threonylcarbamoyladenosine biosynthesis protein TsaE